MIGCNPIDPMRMSRFSSPRSKWMYLGKEYLCGIDKLFDELASTVSLINGPDGCDGPPFFWRDCGETAVGTTTATE